jgi:hypothetical protein
MVDEHGHWALARWQNGGGRRRDISIMGSTHINSRSRLDRGQDRALRSTKKGLPEPLMRG